MYVKEYYRVIEVNPPDLDTIDLLIEKYHAVHLGNFLSETRDEFYRKFLIRADEGEVVILKLLYSHMHINKLSKKEVDDLIETGYIR